jgi:hypothetical protein
MKSSEQNKQKTNVSPTRPSKEFQEKWRQIRIKELRKAYLFKKNKLLEKFIYDNNFQNRVFYYEYLIGQLENKKDTLDEDNYNAIKKYLTGEIAGREDAVNEWLSEETDQEISKEDDTDQNKRREEILLKKGIKIPEEKQAPGEPEVTIDELPHKVETREDARGKHLQKGETQLTDLQQQEVRKAIEKIEAYIKNAKANLNDAINDLEKKKDWLITEKEKQVEINFDEGKEKSPQIFQEIIIKVPKDFSPQNIKRILTPLKMKVQYWQTILMKLLKMGNYSGNFLNRE